MTPTMAISARLSPAGSDTGCPAGEFDGGVAAAPGDAPGWTLGFGAAPDQPWGSGPTGAGSGPWRTGACAPTDPSHACWNAAVSSPSASLNAWSSLTPSAYERIRAISASRPLFATIQSTAETLSPYARKNRSRVVGNAPTRPSSGMIDPS